MDRARKRNRLAVMVPVASMGDIAFLLIIFFMLTSNFLKEAHVDIEQAASPDIEEIKESSVSVTMDGDGQVWLQGQPCPIEALKGGVQVLIEGSEDKMVMLKIDKRLSQKDFGKVFLSLSNAGAQIGLVGVKE